MLFGSLHEITYEFIIKGLYDNLNTFSKWDINGLFIIAISENETIMKPAVMRDCINSLKFNLPQSSSCSSP